MSEPIKTGWVGRLRLEFTRVGGRTLLTQRTHVGPLAVQKPLYPEGPAVCHTLVLHPPGGIAGNDTLDVGVNLNEGSHVLITMPGATKWYRSQGATAAQRINVNVAPGAVLEWLPPETIIYKDASANMRTGIELAAGGRYVGWEILCLGRTAAGEKFDGGEIHQATDVVIGGVLVWSERCRLEGGSPLLGSAVGLAGAPVSAIMIAAGKSVTPSLVAQCRAVAVDAAARSGVTAMNDILVVRYLGRSSEQARRYFVALWHVLRPFLAGRDAVPPRIWST